MSGKASMGGMIVSRLRLPWFENMMPSTPAELPFPRRLGGWVNSRDLHCASHAANGDLSSLCFDSDGTGLEWNRQAFARLANIDSVLLFRGYG
jgi:hypothetical protein